MLSMFAVGHATAQVTPFEKASPAAAADLAYAVPASQEMKDLIQKGQASKFAVITEPPGADVEIDGNSAGITPLSLVLLRHGDTPRIITIRKNGYAPVEKRALPDGNIIPIGLTLEPQESIPTDRDNTGKKPSPQNQPTGRSAANRPSARTPVTLYIAPLSRGTEDIANQLTRDILKACPAAIHINQYVERSDFQLAWDSVSLTLSPIVVVPIRFLPLPRITSVLYRVSDGSVDHAFEDRTISGLAHDLCAYITRK